MDREQNSFKIADLKTFLDKNIDMLKNNWDDKRHVETQTNFECNEESGLNTSINNTMTQMMN